MRKLGIPALIDRIIQQAIKQILEPIFEAKFYKHSYGFRPGRSQEHAINSCDYIIVKGYTQVVDIDIKSFFDNIDHSILLKILWFRGVRDKKLLSIIINILKAPIENEGIPTKGTPQGGVISPLLANIYLNEFDQWINDQWNDCSEWFKNRSKYKTNLKRAFLVRFADDFKVFTKTRNEAIKLFHAISQWLKDRLRLDISEEKSGIVNLKNNPTHFLGFDLKVQIGRNTGKEIGIIKIGQDEKLKISKRIVKDWKAFAKSTSKESMFLASRLSAYIRGIRNYFEIANTVYADLAQVDFRTHKARDNIFKSLSKDKKMLMGEIYTRACCRPSSKNTDCITPIKHSVLLCKGIKFRIPRSYAGVKRNSENIYDVEVKISCYQSELNALRYKLKSSSDSLEKADIQLSLFTQQKGLDPIAGDLLDIKNMQLHRKLPGNSGGQYEFKNCVLLNKLTHTIVHATFRNMKTFCNVFLNKRKSEKLQKLWYLAH